MRRIVVLAHNLAVDSEVVRYAARIAKASRSEVTCLALVTSYASTAELIHSQPEETMGELRSLRARQTTADWVGTLESLRTKQWEKAERQKEELKEFFGRQGIAFNCHVLPFDAHSIFKALKDLMPLDVLIASGLRFPKDLAAQGIMTLGDLGSRFRCPAIDVRVMQRFLDATPWRLRMELAACLGGAIAASVWFWREAAEINRVLMTGGLVSAVAIMAAAALIAWGYGKTVQCLLRVVKLDIY